MPSLGVCYYPEQWPQSFWKRDAEQMASLGIRWVRLGEFAWSQLEPEPGQFRFDWLDRAMDLLLGAGLQLMLGTPSAAPPRWMLDRFPDMLAEDAQAQPRRFGSRRHYCFSHAGYREAAAAMAARLAERYADRVSAWQIDNEYGCHDTSLSYSRAAERAFQVWLAEQYEDIDALNEAWGTRFWSMEYRDFSDIALPQQSVTEANPAQILAFRRFSSAQIERFNRAQIVAIRQHSRAPISHNLMGRETGFDHFKLAEPLDFVTWDSYPLGFLSDRLDADDAHKHAFLRQGDPDMQAFHHDLYRAVGRGSWWVMEQQAGAVNWAPHNPAPLLGMLRLWTWEAFAHGAEVVSFFRWRQYPKAQEQWHSGLLRADSSASEACAEVSQIARELEELKQLSAQPALTPARARVAIVFDYASCWAWEAQPQGQGFDGFMLAFANYRTLRRLGLNIDFLSADSEDLSGYDLVLLPAILSLSAPLHRALERYQGIALLGPRSDIQTDELGIRVPLGPALAGLSVTSLSAQTFPAREPLAIAGQGALYWREQLSGEGEVLLRDAEGAALALGGPQRFYLGAWLDDAARLALLSCLAKRAGLPLRDLDAGVRIRETETHRFYFNYGATSAKVDGLELPPAAVVWRAL